MSDRAPSRAGMEAVVSAPRHNWGVCKRCGLHRQRGQLNLCYSCHQHRYRHSEQAPRSRCHPRVKHYALGLCLRCYGYKNKYGRLPRRVTFKASREDLAWASGIYAGEGCVYVSRGPTHAQVVFSVTQVSKSNRPPEMLLRLKRIFGFGYVVGGKKPIVKVGSVWAYRTSGYEPVQAITAMLWPWLTPEKKAQAKRKLCEYLALTNRGAARKALRAT